MSTLRDEVASKDCMVEEKRRLAADLLHVQNDLSITRASLEKHVKELGEVHGQNSWFSQQLQVCIIQLTLKSQVDFVA